MRPDRSNASPAPERRAAVAECPTGGAETSQTIGILPLSGNVGGLSQYAPVHTPRAPGSERTPSKSKHLEPAPTLLMSPCVTRLLPTTPEDSGAPGAVRLST